MSPSSAGLPAVTAASQSSTSPASGGPAVAEVCVDLAMMLSFLGNGAAGLTRGGIVLLFTVYNSGIAMS
jgi:hypothetical protein